MARPTTDIVLVYTGPDGEVFEQPLADVSESGTLIDPETGDDLELVGWRFADQLIDPITATRVFAERGYTRELGSMDPRMPYSADERAEIKKRFAEHNTGAQALGQALDAEPPA